MDFPKSHLEGWVSKIIPLVALLITTAVSTVLLYLNIVQWNFQPLSWTGEFSSRAGVIQVVVEILATVQTFTLLTLVNFATRIALCKSNSTLDVLKYRAAICSRRLDLSLPRLSLVLVLLVLALMKIPAFLWANSLALSPSERFTSNSLYVPILGTDHFIHNYNGNFLQNCWGVPAASTSYFMAGPYSSCPGRDFVDGLLQAASSATMFLGSGNNISRIDVDGAYYIGRSYGVGAGVGLSDGQQLENWGNGVLDNYTYQDFGFDTKVLCGYSDSLTSANWSIGQIQASDKKHGIPAIFEANGVLPDGSSSFYTTWGFSVDDIVAWATTNSTHNPNYISIAAGSTYKIMNGTQCNVTFTPKNFDVVVNYPSVSSSRLVINVTAIDDDPVSERVVDPDWHLRTLVLEQITAISMTSTTLYGSILGQAFLSNVQTSCADSSPLSCMQDSWENIIDNLLLLLTAAQIQKHNENNPTIWDTTQFRQVSDQENGTASQIGTRTYILLTCILNLICLIIWVVEAFRWSFWKDLPKFNIMDLKSAILGGATGGGSVVTALQEVESQGVSWNGASDDSKVGEMQVRAHIIDVDKDLKRVALKGSLVSDGTSTVGRRPWAPFFYEKLSNED